MSTGFGAAPRPSRSQSLISHTLPRHEFEEESWIPETFRRTRSETEKEVEGKGEETVPFESREAHVLGLAQSLRRNETILPGAIANPFTIQDEESPLNPNGKNFKAKDWIKMVLAIEKLDPEKYPQVQAGMAFKDLSVHGFGSPTDYQKDVLNILLELGSLTRWLVGMKKQRIQVLRDFDGLVRSGEMLVVLGRPGSGCSTFLKTISGEMNGLNLSDNAMLNYQGIPVQEMYSSFKGEAIYTAETDIHFPHLTVGDTLLFAAEARAPGNLPDGVSKNQFVRHLRDVVMTILGLSHTINTRVGNDFIRGVSGGERKRVSIAEAALSSAPIQCWDNSTRGLDSANATEFCRNLALVSRYAGTVNCVAIYQAPQSAYDMFDKVTLLYEGRQIYFGPTTAAKQFFVDMGFHCPERQTTADFLTSLTSSSERKVRPGFEEQVPRTPDEFATRWKQSSARHELLREIQDYEERYPIGGPSYEAFLKARRTLQSNHQRIKSPYMISIWNQISLCIVRGFKRLRGDFSMTLTTLIGNFCLSLILGSVFYNLPSTTSSFYSRGALLFYAVLLNALSSVLEMLTLYAQRPIVEKHSRYAFYHPLAEAIASIICDTPYKVINSVTSNLPLYFLPNLRRSAGPFFIFWLFSLVTTYTMSMIFRTIAALSRTLSQALVPAALLIVGMVMFTGFVIPTRNMLGWSRWMNYINPIAYSFEALMTNEFDGRDFACSVIVPSGGFYDSVPMVNRICSTLGAEPGSTTVSGKPYLEQSFDYSRAHLWRNLGILLGFVFFFGFIYLVATEYISEQKSKGEILLFRRGHQPRGPSDLESASKLDNKNGHAEGANTKQAESKIQRQTSIFHWQDVCYDIKIKGKPRRILDHVDGWVKPGTCTALMGVSGAGKTTLLDVLATRVSVGVISGEMLVDGKLRDSSFQRKTGYVQQQDLHLPTSTVREALQFSAKLRQPAHVSRKEKMDYVEEIISLLEMESYADAVVGAPGVGLNVEQRKRLTIAVELAAKPQLLLFLDEPTSGLDSQTSWSILNLLDTLTQHGQAILCTIHQPSAMLFQRFDRLLFLAKGGKTIYFGEIGENSSTLSSYFERNGARSLSADENPAEWMLDVIGAAPGSHCEIDWPKVWRESPEHTKVKEHLGELKSTLSTNTTVDSDPESLREYAAPFHVQLYEVSLRAFAAYYRTPTYIWSKALLCNLSALYVGFVFFKAKRTPEGLKNQMYSVFMLLTIFGTLVEQIMPHFVTQRDLYEVRERPAKTYSWVVFMASNIIVELPWNTLMSAIMYFCWYYPVGFYTNAEPSNAVTVRGALMFLFIWVFLLFTSTFAHMVIAGIELPETAGSIVNVLFSLCLIFCGVIATKEQMPGFWIFMYRVNPFTYLISGMLATGLSGNSVECDSIEYLRFDPPGTQTCQQYMKPFIDATNNGYLLNPSATADCAFCPLSHTDTFLKGLFISYGDVWRNFGLMWAYILFNVVAAVSIYWLARVPKGQKAS